ncbi:MAG: hypothetical protein JNJ54_11885 [Myxococcaceae bacterium]|nr:hypothetical protein [Myxococcaceae bacterium]
MGSKILRQGDRYKAKLEKTLADGKVTKQEAAAILRDAKDGTFRQVEAHYLSGFVGLNAKKFDPEAHAKLLAFVKTEMVAFAEIAGDTGLPKPRKQPALTPDSEKSGRVTWEARAGQLTVDGFGMDDALQGQVGDCYLIAALAAVAKSKPELLAKAIKANDDGTYTVTFYERKTKTGKPAPVQVTVDGTFATRGSTLEYGAARSTKELWPLIFEKAYASWKGGFDAIEGGMSATALEALTGKKPDWFPVDDAFGSADIFKKLKAVCASGAAVVALSKPWDPSEQGIVSDHAYTLLGVEEKAGKQFVTLRNPWGEREPGRDGRDDGIFTMPLEQFLTSFATVEFAKL